jgi:hypothetical protein
MLLYNHSSRARLQEATSLMIAHQSRTSRSSPKLPPTPLGSIESDHPTVRLESWKQIAVHFGRDVSTVRRWEAEGHLPIHRLPSGKRSGVFAYVHELEEWRHRSSVYTEGGPLSLADSTFSSAPLPQELNTTEQIPIATGASSADPLRQRIFTFVTPWIATSVLLLLAGVALVARTLLRGRVPPAHPAVDAHVPVGGSQEFYLQGRYYWNLRTGADLNHAIDLFTKAIVADPNYAAPYAGLADSYVLLCEFGQIKGSDAFPRALAAARHAVELDPSSAEAHRSLAFILN